MNAQYNDISEKIKASTKALVAAVEARHTLLMSRCVSRKACLKNP